MSMYIGEALVGEGNEIAHIDLLIGDKDGPVGHAFASALARQSKGHSNLLAVLAPNLAVKPATVLIKMVSSADTGYYYVTKKNPRTKTEKMELKKYDPVARKHVEFREAKIK